VSLIRKEKILKEEAALTEEELTVAEEPGIVKKKSVVTPDYCSLCKGGTKKVTYKDVSILKRFISRRGRIIPASRSGLCSKHQRQVARAIKVARILALLPFVSEE
jgi:small subunit ribosomal protein S18